MIRLFTVIVLGSFSLSLKIPKPLCDAEIAEYKWEDLTGNSDRPEQITPFLTLYQTESDNNYYLWKCPNILASTLCVESANSAKYITRAFWPFWGHLRKCFKNRLTKIEQKLDELSRLSNFQKNLVNPDSLNLFAVTEEDETVTYFVMYSEENSADSYMTMIVMIRPEDLEILNIPLVKIPIFEFVHSMLEVSPTSKLEIKIEYIEPQDANSGPMIKVTGPDGVSGTIEMMNWGVNGWLRPVMRVIWPSKMMFDFHINRKTYKLSQLYNEMIRSYKLDQKSPEMYRQVRESIDPRYYVNQYKDTMEIYAVFRVRGE